MRLREEYRHALFNKIRSLKQQDIQDKLFDLLNSGKFEEIVKCDILMRPIRDAMILEEIRQISKKAAKLQKQLEELEKKKDELK